MSDDDHSLTPQLLLQGYAQGVFPMAESREDPSVFWVDPSDRGILPLDGFHISRSLARRMRRGGYDITLNQCFDEVVLACADRQDTWINAQIFDLYRQLHALGHAHSLEIWHDDALIGGVYGVALGAAFFGESMFSRATDGSKLALTHLVDHLRCCDFHLFDTQFITGHLASLGAVEIPRRSYHALLRPALQLPADILSRPLDTNPQGVLQRMTQTS
ncbi:leucyl/phenylalanyl-tRNA--protein transferase [Roseovarius faecimaris]|uniref:Leucyl/phenylalanyl-tRNA--protein transferase n=1 Tax=Roseovarius faecimaris TaxID=2494550 RepID=A0A6I6IRI6_9RHOB|nr:leucyl/phenylalanyl-tRNA--protein transferase [Roseovarius faecimaris]QGX98493.1 leucyl/phenylalanyl-tRNA--protein transferase [Roseovarius faecimaris]